MTFENDEQGISSKRYYLPNVEIKDYNVMTDGNDFFDQPVKNDKVIDYTTGCLLDNSFFKDHYKMVAVDLSKQQALDADPKAMQQINFTANLDRARNASFYFILEEAKETVLDILQGTVKVL